MRVAEKMDIYAPVKEKGKRKRKEVSQNTSNKTSKKARKKTKSTRRKGVWIWQKNY